jgi:hypothetical protein
VAQFGHRLGLDLPDALSGDPVDLANLLQGAGLAIDEAKAQPNNAASRSDSVASTDWIWPRSSVKETASRATTASESS